MAASVPKAEARPQVSIQFNILGDRDWGHLFRTFEFKGMVNGGYIVRCALFDTHYNLLRELTENGYLAKSRSNILTMSFQIKWGPQAQPPEKATKRQLVNIVSLNALGGPSDKGLLEFVGIDPPSWFLNTGDGSGDVYTGNVSKVIEQVVSQYAPSISLDISETRDSKENKFWMMRQDPKTFISSLLDWSSSVTQKKTQWLVGMSGNNLFINEQADLPSEARAYYRYWDGRSTDTIHRWELLSNNALSIAETKIITQGLSSISGRYLDRAADQREQFVFAKDITTSNKKIAEVGSTRSFTKPDDSVGSGPPDIGWTAVSGIPEVYSAGDLGLRYEEYIDGRPRAMYLNLINSLLRIKLTVIGHGEWSDVLGLGCDTMYLKWMAAPKNGNRIYFLTGNWLVYGFHHKVDRHNWWTDVYGARYDYNASAEKVSGKALT